MQKPQSLSQFSRFLVFGILVSPLVTACGSSPAGNAVTGRDAASTESSELASGNTFEFRHGGSRHKDGGSSPDAGEADAGSKSTPDAGPSHTSDAGPEGARDAGESGDAGPSHSSDAGTESTPDAGSSSDAGSSHSRDAGSEGTPDAGTVNDAGTPADAGTSTDAGSSGGTDSIWHPTTAQPIHFHWMIGANFTSADILSGQDGQVVYDIDGQGSTAADVAAIHAAGGIAVCYVDVGTLEQGRPDYNDFPASVIGPAVQGWPGENWLLVTAANQSVILPLMQARFVNWCQAKGFDAIEPDNLDGWTNISNITEADNVAYDLAIGQLGHAVSLSIGAKNVMTDLDSSQYPSFVAAFDWALNEQCFQYQECGVYTAAGSFIPAGKAVWDVEYSTTPNCTQADQDQMNAQLTDLDLVGPGSGYKYTPCIPDSQTTW